MKQEHVLNCSFSSWYPNFKNVTIRSKIIPLSKEFVEYLKADSVVLPGKPYCQPRNSDDESDSEEWQNMEEDPEQEVAQAPEFNEIDTRIKEAISELGGSVFPKLNWSAPRDAVWISHDSTLKCKTPSDVYLLLKSSDAVTAVLCDAFKHCEDSQAEMADGFELILRKWQEIYPGMEFRCFVKNHELIGICQRDTSSFYEFILESEDDICSDILNFFENKIAERFPDSSYVFDVYRFSDEKISLIDFSPFGLPTDALLFSWNDIKGMDGANAEEDIPELMFRAVPYEVGVQPSPYVCSRMPKDILDLTSGEDVNKLVDFLNVSNLIRRPGEDSDENDA